VKNSRYKELFDLMPCGIQVIDFNYRYVYINKVLLEELGMKSTELVGHKIHQVFPDFVETKAYSVLDECLRNRQSQIVTNEYLNGDTVVVYELEIKPIEEGLIIFTQDISEEIRGKILLEESKKRLEAKVKKRTEDLAYLNKYLEEKVAERTTELEHFTHLAAHDLRQPCSILITYAEMLTEILDEKTHPQIWHISEVFLKNSYTMLKLIDGFRALAKIDGHNLIKKKEKIGEVFLKRTNLFELANHNIIVLNRVTSQVEVYKDLIEILFNNLILNVIKHAKQEDTVYLTFEEKTENDITYYIVKNDYPKTVETKDLFKPFNRRNREVTGEGLGLSICKRIIDYHEGHAMLKSDGKHFSFIFSLNQNAKLLSSKDSFHREDKSN
tara:strand:+ start:16599 stop:17750 length:1152 start_codon:yes stop_codon:yes gene_type:complete